MFESLGITVMLGGPSEERSISLQSGKAVAAALRTLGHRVSEVDPREPDWALTSGTDAVFLALHGSFGEDGTIQRQLDEMEVVYTGCDAEASRVAFDKILAKDRLRANAVPTPRSGVLAKPVSEWPPGWSPPAMLKPARQGSSVGLQFVNRHDEFSKAVLEAFRYDSEVLIEERVSGRELTVGILGERILPIVEIRPRTGAYDYQSKYTPGATEYFCPAPLDPELTKKVKAIGLAAFEAIGGRDYGRVDIMAPADGVPVVLEVNTLPGMTETSLLPMAAAAEGVSFPALCQQMIELAMLRRRSTRV